MLEIKFLSLNTKLACYKDVTIHPGIIYEIYTDK